MQLDPSVRVRIEARFWSKVDKSGECWLWTGKPDRQGRGRFVLDGRRSKSVVIPAHIFAFEAFVEELPPGFLVRHTCGVRLCVRPSHLFAQSKSDFYRDQSEAKKGMLFTSDGVIHVGRAVVECACGCGARFERKPNEMQRGSRQFFLNRSHVMRSGEHSALWRGGGPHYYGPDWKSASRLVRERDGVCKACGKTAEENGQELDVHHIVPLRLSHDNSPANLVALCVQCHHTQSIAERAAVPSQNRERWERCLSCQKWFSIPVRLRRKTCSDECARARRNEVSTLYASQHRERTRETKRRWALERKEEVRIRAREWAQRKRASQQIS